jgi:hypothetical protein
MKLIDQNISEFSSNNLTMRKQTFLLVMISFLVSIQFAFSQTFKAGDKVEALVNNAWKEVKILKAVPGKTNVYEVEAIGATQSTFQVGKANLRVAKNSVATTNAVGKTVAEAATPVEHLGRYDLYSGIPTMYIGHCIILGGGKYKVALSTDESNYENGEYTFNKATNSFDWETGLFHRNSWKGKLINKGGNSFRIEFNRATFADSN